MFYGPHASAGWPTKMYLQQLCTDTGCSLENLPGVMERESGKSMLAAQLYFFSSDNLQNFHLNSCVT